jgi:hypothetical protein
MTNRRHYLGVLLLLAGGVACKDEPSSSLGVQHIAGQTGDEGARPWSPGGADSDSVCPFSETVEKLASLDEDTELGFSAADILTLVSGNREARVRYNARPVVGDYLDYALQVTPGGLDEALRLELSHDGSAPRYRARTSTASDGGMPAYCRGQLELDVTVELRSESGALDERWWGTLTASDASQAVVSLEAPTWRGRLPKQPDRDEGRFVNAQEGSLDVVDSADPGSKLAWVDVVLRFRSEAVDGSVNGWVQNSTGGAFVVPQRVDDNDETGWIGVIGDGYYRRSGVDD